MLGMVRWLPVTASFYLALVHLFTSEAEPGLKSLVWIVFVAAVILQFRSPFPLWGFLVQAGLALTLAIWWKLETRE